MKHLMDGSKAEKFLKQVLEVSSSSQIEEILQELPIISEKDWSWDLLEHNEKWKEGSLHWVPLGLDRGNAGRVKLAGSPIFPIGERTTNAEEALIEMHRRLELKKDPAAPMPSSPREACKRYFDLPPLDQIYQMSNEAERKKVLNRASELAGKIRVRLRRKDNQHTIVIEDDGIGQTAAKMSKTLLSLGSSDKGDKPYLIGVFGQGGSSAYAASEYSFLVTRRHPELLEGSDDVGFTIVKKVIPANRRDQYWAYLAIDKSGRVPSLPGKAADALSFKHGTRIGHIKYDFGKFDPTGSLYGSLNHLLFNPVLPYALFTKKEADKRDVMYGNGYRLSRLTHYSKTELDKAFHPQKVLKDK